MGAEPGAERRCRREAHRSASACARQGDVVGGGLKFVREQTFKQAKSLVTAAVTGAAVPAWLASAAAVVLGVFGFAQDAGAAFGAALIPALLGGGVLPTPSGVWRRRRPRPCRRLEMRQAPRGLTLGRSDRAPRRYFRSTPDRLCGSSRATGTTRRASRRYSRNFAVGRKLCSVPPTCYSEDAWSSSYSALLTHSTPGHSNSVFRGGFRTDGASGSDPRVGSLLRSGQDARAEPPGRGGTGALRHEPAPGQCGGRS